MYSQSEIEKGYDSVKEAIEWITQKDLQRMRSYDDYELQDEYAYEFDYSYNAQLLLDEFMQGLTGVRSGYGSSKYFQTTQLINGNKLKIRLSNHPGYSDQGYRRVHGNTGIEALDNAINSAEFNHVVSFIIISGGRNSVKKIREDKEDRITEYEIKGINSEGDLYIVLDEIMWELNELID